MYKINYKNYNASYVEQMGCKLKTRINDINKKVVICLLFQNID